MDHPWNNLSDNQGHPSGSALFACFTCQEGKRKCDKKLPKCTLCSKRKISCLYPKSRKPRKSRRRSSDLIRSASAESDKDADTEAKATDGRAVKRYSPVALMFLEKKVYGISSMRILPSSHTISDGELDLIGNEVDIRTLTSEYFQTVHKWLPIVSRRRFYEHLACHQARHRDETILLLHCMKLITIVPRSGDFEATNELYITTKQLYDKAEAAGLFSLEALQAKILLSYYEMGHSIYPSAYLSVGYCARYGVALGLNKHMGTGQSSQQQFLPDEIEERRRTWWSILILDRYFQLGHPDQKLATEEPRITDQLPIDDDAWDEQDPGIYQMTTVASMPNIESGRFAKLSQGAYLLGRVIQHISDPFTDPSFHNDEAQQLYRTLRALLHLADVESSSRNLEFCTQKSICYSALFLLEEHAAEIRNQFSLQNLYETHQSTEILSEDLQLAVNQVVEITTSWVEVHETHLPFLAPFCLHMIYQAARVQLKFIAISRTTEADFQLILLKEALKVVAKRWRSAVVYLDLIETHENKALAYISSNKDSSLGPEPRITK